MYGSTDGGAIRPWLLLGRVHGSGLLVVALLGVALAGNRDPGTWVWIATVLFVGSWWTWALNDIADMGVDRASPEKQHFPLVAGTIRPEAAVAVVTWLGIATTWWGAFVWPQAAGWLVAMTACAVVYNLASKRSWAWHLVCLVLGPLALALAPVWAFVAAGGTLGLEIVVVAGLWFFMMLFAFVVGGAKDTHADPECNLLRRLGMWVQPTTGGRFVYEHSTKSAALVIALSMVAGVLGVVSVAAIPSIDAWVGALFLAMSVVLLVHTVATREALRSKRIRSMALAPVCAALALVLIVAPEIGAPLTVAFLVGTPVYALLTTRLTFGAWTPRT